MGIFNWLFGGGARTVQTSVSQRPVVDLNRLGAPGTYRRLDGRLTASTGTYHLKMAGAEHYQDALWRIAEGGESSRKRSIRVEKLAMLVPEPENPYDALAVAVYIDRAHVGYVGRAEAPMVGAFMPAGALTGACEAAIVGALPTAGAERPRLSVYLDL